MVTVEQLVRKSLDFHCHGIGSFDFTETNNIKLQAIEDILAAQMGQVILTLYLPRSKMKDFFLLMDTFADGKIQGLYSHIAGIALEGPILASRGGTPKNEVWTPTQDEWRRLAACGKQGLVYVVLSPDAYLSDSQPSNFTKQRIIWMVETLLENGVLPAPGHFSKVDPIKSAIALQTVFDVVETWGQGQIITDHLFNDMPHNFKHAWRSPTDKVKRAEEIQALQLDSWTLKNLDEKMGLIPAMMIKNAHKGLVKLCQNFDGDHVDLAIVKKTVELVGAENMLMMTDSIEGKRLAGRDLTMRAGSTLLYQDEGIVAAGSQNVARQIKNMLSIDLSISQIELITHTVPFNIIAQHQKNVSIL